MKKKSNEIVFFGSGPVAKKSLNLLLKHQEVSSVITKPSTLNEMKRACPSAHIYAVSNKTELDELFNTENIPNKIGVLIDFGVIVPKKIIDHFRYGIINSHFSLLPEWRGADPITFSILSGQKETGVTLMKLVEALDEGPILCSSPLKIKSDDNSISLTEDLVELSDELVKECLDSYIEGKIIARSQEDAAMELGLEYKPTYSKKISKKDGEIDWDKPAGQLEREIKAYIEWPKSYTSLNNIDLIIKKAEVIDKKGEAGTYQAGKKNLIVFCSDKALSIVTLQPSGKKEMPIEAFLAGYKL